MDTTDEEIPPESKMTAEIMRDEAVKILQRTEEKTGKTPENDKTLRVINDLAYWLDDTLLKLELAEKLIRIHYRQESGVLPASYEAWRKIREGDDYKPKIHLVT